MHYIVLSRKDNIGLVFLTTTAFCHTIHRLSTRSDPMRHSLSRSSVLRVAIGPLSVLVRHRCRTKGIVRHACRTNSYAQDDGHFNLNPSGLTTSTGN